MNESKAPSQAPSQASSLRPDEAAQAFKAGGEEGEEEIDAGETSEAGDLDGKPPFTLKEKRAFYSLQRACMRMILLTGAIGLALSVYLWLSRGFSWGIGAFLGVLLVLGNLVILYRVLLKSVPDRVEKPIWVTILKFYLLFFLTILIAFLIIILGIGNPFGFLSGLLVFIPSFLAVLAWSGINHFAEVKGRARASGKADSAL